MKAIGLVPLLLIGCDRAPDVGTVELVDITAITGPHFITTCGADPSTQIVEVNGPGITLLDADGDGDLDVFLANGSDLGAPESGPGSRLFRNLLADEGTLRFVDTGVMLRRWATSATAADIDGDGDPDLYVTCIGPDVLLRNDGGVFTDITASAGISVPNWSTGAAPGDVDGDGDIDLFVTRYVDWDFSAPPVPPIDFRGQDVLAGPAGLRPLDDVLLLNDGAGGFTSESPLDARPAFGLNAVILDVDDDGAAEILVGNDGMANHLLELDAGHWRDTALERGFATNMAGAEQATMGMAIGDVNGDGAADVFTSNFSSDSNTLLVQEGGSFVDRTNRYAIGGPSRAMLGWTSRFIDLDHDGDEDLLTLNGHVYPNASLATMDSTYSQRPLLLLRDGDRFTPHVATSGWLAQPRLDRAAAFGDLDGDGDLDIVTAELHGPIRIIENRAHHPGRVGVVHDLSSEVPGTSHTLHGARHWLLPTADFQGCSAPQAHTTVPR
ncbi:MAG: VCBS repeat-containing protein [Phycisphaerales bacterium]|jgi:hypothetical protein|nr:VCBS repeat-containing protein [Phycisphaerales bacterium]